MFPAYCILQYKLIMCKMILPMTFFCVNYKPLYFQLTKNNYPKTLIMNDTCVIVNISLRRPRCLRKVLKC